MTVVTALGKGQVVIPKVIRDRLGLTPGRKLSVQIRDDEIVFHLLPKDPIRALYGFLKDGPSTKDLLRERRKERLLEERKIARLTRSR